MPNSSRTIFTLHQIRMTNGRRGKKHSRPSSSGSSTGTTPACEKRSKLTAHSEKEDSVPVFREDEVTPATVENTLCELLQNGKAGSLINGYINKSIESLRTELKVSFDRQLSNLESELFEANQEIARLKKENSTLSTRIDNVTDKVANLDKRVIVTENEVEELEMYGRRNGIRIYGVEETGPAEDCVKLATDIFATKLGINVEKSDISRAHRVGKPSRDPRIKTKRAIILKFTRHDRKEEIIRARRNLKRSGIVIREDLTAKRFGLIREASNIVGVNSVWSNDGRITALFNGTRHSIASNEDIRKLSSIAARGS